MNENNEKKLSIVVGPEGAVEYSIMKFLQYAKDVCQDLKKAGEKIQLLLSAPDGAYDADAHAHYFNKT